MKKKDIWISVAVIAATVLAVYFYSRRQGYIKIDAPGVEMKLRSGWFRSASVGSGEEPVAVRARTYRPERLSITGKQDGSTWQISSYGPWGELANIKVTNDETTVLKLGPPFLLKTDVRQIRTRAVSIGLSLIGQAGEHYSSQITKNRRAVGVPTLQIVDESGKVLVAGKFEYG